MQYQVAFGIYIKVDAPPDSPKTAEEIARQVLDRHIPVELLPRNAEFRLDTDPFSIESEDGMDWS